jgi:hypothetical protein
LFQLSYPLSVLSTGCAIAVARLDLDPNFELVANFFKIYNIVVRPKGTKRPMRGRSLVDPNGASLESKDMRIQLCHGRFKVRSGQRRWQPMEKLDVRLESVRHV